MATIRKPKNIKGLTQEKFRERIDSMKELYNDYYENYTDDLHVCVAKGNSKTNEIPSVSLMPVLNCGNCKSCHKQCYDLRNDCVYTNVQKSRARNSAILFRDRDKFFREVESVVMINRAFRFHIGGDLVDYDYFDRICKMANRNPHCTILIFTKMFGIVNDWISNNGDLPENFKVIFSGWVGQEMDNPYNLPISNPIFGDGSTAARDGDKLCTGDCTECFKENKLCFNLKKGEGVVFNAH